MTGRGAGPKTIDEYVAQAPEPSRGMLQQLRQVIRAAAPQATELVNHGAPAFRHVGLLVSFEALDDGSSFYVLSGDVRQAFAEELKPYQTPAGRIDFRAGVPLPEDLVTRLVRARVAENERPRRSEV